MPIFEQTNGSRKQLLRAHASTGFHRGFSQNSLAATAANRGNKREVEWRDWSGWEREREREREREGGVGGVFDSGLARSTRPPVCREPLRSHALSSALGMMGAETDQRPDGPRIAPNFRNDRRCIRLHGNRVPFLSGKEEDGGYSS